MASGEISIDTFLSDLFVVAFDQRRKADLVAFAKYDGVSVSKSLLKRDIMVVVCDMLGEERVLVKPHCQLMETMSLMSGGESKQRQGGEASALA